MGRPRTPTKIHELSGAFLKDPQRRADRAGEPVDARPLGDPPDYFDEKMVAAWLDVVEMAPAGVLAAADRGLVESAARMLEEIRQLETDVVTKDGQVVTIRKPVAASELNAFLRCLTEMGLTPAARSKVKLPGTAAAKSGFDALGPPN